jgi:hypothetical protein
MAAATGGQGQLVASPSPGRRPQRPQRLAEIGHPLGINLGSGRKRIYSGSSIGAQAVLARVTGVTSVATVVEEKNGVAPLGER